MINIRSPSSQTTPFQFSFCFNSEHKYFTPLIRAQRTQSVSSLSIASQSSEVQVTSYLSLKPQSHQTGWSSECRRWGSCWGSGSCCGWCCLQRTWTPARPCSRARSPGSQRCHLRERWRTKTGDAVTASEHKRRMPRRWLGTDPVLSCESRDRLAALVNGRWKPLRAHSRNLTEHDGQSGACVSTCHWRECTLPRAPTASCGIIEVLI